MSKKSCLLFLGVSFLFSLLGLDKLPVISAAQPSVPQLTIKVPSSNNVDAATWCKTGVSQGREQPLGFAKVLFYRDKSDPEKKEYIVGCITNNSRQTIQHIPVSYVLQYPAGKNTFSGGFHSLTVATPIQPRQTVYFRSGFEIDSDASGVDMSVVKTKQKDQTITYEPIQRLIIQRRN